MNTTAVIIGTVFTIVGLAVTGIGIYALGHQHGRRSVVIAEFVGPLGKTPDQLGGNYGRTKFEDLGYSVFTREDYERFQNADHGGLVKPR